MIPGLSAIDAVCNAAELLLPVRETVGPDGHPNNHGRFVEAIQVGAGGAPGDYWCDEFVWYVGHGTLRHLWPMPRTGACQASLEFARKNGVLRYAQPQRGDQFFLLREDGTAHHTGFVLAVNADGTWRSCEGNARADDSPSSDGDGVHDCTRGNDGLRYAFARWVLLPPPAAAPATGAA